MALNDSKIIFWLSLSGASLKKQSELITAFGKDLFKLWDGFHTKSEEITGLIGVEKYEKLERFHSDDFLSGEISRYKTSGIGLVTVFNPLFPKSLKDDGVCAPFVMYYKGHLDILNSPCIAVVGTRRCSVYGREQAKNISGTLAKNGVTVVSGLAAGIDTYAHISAVEQGGKTVAVLGSGLNRITPTLNIPLSEKIVESGGLILSEYPPETDAAKYTFPERNRLISGLCKGIAVIEAGEKSGALITARFAAEQNREVFALPGNVNSAKSKGTNALIAEGANFITCGEDILKFFHLPIMSEEKQAELTQDEIEIFSQIDGECGFDEIAEKTEKNPSEILSILTGLEIRGLILSSGGIYFKK